jgi:hypothetical protein
MLPGAVSFALACVWSIQSSSSSKLFAIVGAEKTAARAAKTTATQTGRAEPRLFMTTIPTNQRRLSNTAGNDGYPSISEPAMGNSVSTDSWKNAGAISAVWIASARQQFRHLGGHSGQREQLLERLGIQLHELGLAEEGQIGVIC